MAIVAFLHKPRKRLGQGQSVGCLERGMLQQGTYLNNTLKKLRGYGGRRIRKPGNQGNNSSRRKKERKRKKGGPRQHSA